MAILSGPLILGCAGGGALVIAARRAEARGNPGRELTGKEMKRLRFALYVLFGLGIAADFAKMTGLLNSFLH